MSGSAGLWWFATLIGLVAGEVFLYLRWDEYDSYGEGVAVMVVFTFGVLILAGVWNVLMAIVANIQMAG